MTAVDTDDARRLQRYGYRQELQRSLSRRDRRTVQTSIRQFTHTRTGRLATVIGTFHFGHPNYYRDLREAIDKLEADGAVIQCENSRLNKDHSADVDAHEHETLKQLQRASQLNSARLHAVGWAEQITELGCPDHWQVVDLTVLDIIRRLGPVRAREVARQMLRKTKRPASDRRALPHMHLMTAIIMRVLSDDQRIVKVAGKGPADDVLLDARNQVALDAVAATDRDVVLIWGLAHLPGLDAGLAALGFERSGPPQWHTVTNRRPGVPSALLRLLLGRPVTARPDR